MVERRQKLGFQIDYILPLTTEIDNLQTYYIPADRKAEKLNPDRRCHEYNRGIGHSSNFDKLALLASFRIGLEGRVQERILKSQESGEIIKWKVLKFQNYSILYIIPNIFDFFTYSSCDMKTPWNLSHSYISNWIQR